MKTRKARYHEVQNQAFDSELAGVKSARTKRETYPITEEDRVCVRIDFGPTSKIIAFSIQYECKVGDDWRQVTRVDARPDELPHQHVFHPKKPSKNQRDVIADADESYEKVFHKSLENLTENFEEYKERHQGNL